MKKFRGRAMPASGESPGFPAPRGERDYRNLFSFYRVMEGDFLPRMEEEKQDVVMGLVPSLKGDSPPRAGERETCGKAADSRGSASRVLNPGTAMEDRTGRKNRGCAAVFSAPRAGAAGKPVRERGFFREICRSRREPEGLPAEKTV